MDKNIKALLPSKEEGMDCMKHKVHFFVVNISKWTQVPIEESFLVVNLDDYRHTQKNATHFRQMLLNLTRTLFYR